MPRPPRDFSALTYEPGGRLRRILTPAFVSKAFDIKNPPSPLPQKLKVAALWDTGATGSAITAKVASALGLQPTGSVLMGTAGGPTRVNTHVVAMILPNRVGFPGVIVSELQDTDDYDVIVGMDIITRGDFAVTNVRGRTCMTYRYPSVKRLDFAQEATEIRLAKEKAARKGRGRSKQKGAANASPGRHPRRNQPCPCGSGKKYKKCCGRSDKQGAK